MQAESNRCSAGGRTRKYHNRRRYCVGHSKGRQVSWNTVLVCPHILLPPHLARHDRTKTLHTSHTRDWLCYVINVSCILRIDLGLQLHFRAYKKRNVFEY